MSIIYCISLHAIIGESKYVYAFTTDEIRPDARMHVNYVTPSSIDRLTPHLEAAQSKMTESDLFVRHTSTYETKLLENDYLCLSTWVDGKLCTVTVRQRNRPHYCIFYNPSVSSQRRVLRLLRDLSKFYPYGSRWNRPINPSEREAYLHRWPHACPACQGYGYTCYSYDPSPSGVSLSPGTMQDCDPCGVCVENGICPRCGSQSLDADGMTCSLCHYNYDTTPGYIVPEGPDPDDFYPRLSILHEPQDLDFFPGSVEGS